MPKEKQKEAKAAVKAGVRPGDMDGNPKPGPLHPVRLVKLLSAIREIKELREAKDEAISSLPVEISNSIAPVIDTAIDLKRAELIADEEMRGLIQELRKLSASRLTDYYKRDSDGLITMIPIEEWTDGMKAAVESMTFIGNPPRIKLWNKIMASQVLSAALRELSKRTGSDEDNKRQIHFHQHLHTTVNDYKQAIDKAIEIQIEPNQAESNQADSEKSDE